MGGILRDIRSNTHQKQTQLPETFHPSGPTVDYVDPFLFYPATTAELAPSKAHLPPFFETPTPARFIYATSDFQLSPKRPPRTSFTPTQLFSFSVLLVVLVLQLLTSSPAQHEASGQSVFKYTASSKAQPTCPNVANIFERATVSPPFKMALLEKAKKMAGEFEYKTENLNRGVKAFISQMDEGLQKTGTSMSQIPTYVTAVPNGTEKGLYLAVDLGGTNFRVCSIQLHGDTTFSQTQSKVAIPRELMVAETSRDLFSFLAKQIENFLREHHTDHFEAHVERRKTMGSQQVSTKDIFQLGFTFSFPVNQVGINRGTLARWTKGFDIGDAIGKDVCELLQQEIDALHLPVKVAALVNDTVGTLMTRSYSSPGKTGTLLGAIFGTGTNGAYVENLDKIKKLSSMQETDYDKSTGKMIVNTEWGSFDNQMSVLPNTPYDIDLDRESVNPGIQMFEKRVSGMFLGEILRRTIIALRKESVLFQTEDPSNRDAPTVTENSALYKQWGVDTSFLSLVQADTSPDFSETRRTLANDFGVDAASSSDAEALKVLVNAIGKRAARLSAVAIGAVIITTGHHISHSSDPEEDVVDIGVDGSLVEHYPGFVDHIREALREIPELGEKGEKRIRIGIAKDGSGVGAALIALVAAQAEEGSVQKA
ncbi:MAG: hypothetical protein Q9163_001074 [Psora crenata]